MRGAILLLALAGCSAAEEPRESQISGGNPLIGPGSATHPAVSPDGATVAFMSNMVGVAVGAAINFEIYLVDERGSSLRRVTDNDSFDADIAWTPDGRRLAIKAFRDGNDEIYVMNRDGSGAKKLTAHPASDYQPDFSPDGTTLVFGSDRGGSGGIYLMQLPSGSVDVLLDTPWDEGSPQWSPAGDRIAFVSNREGNDDVYVMQADGSGIRRLTTSTLSDWSPRWSPDGSTLLYISGSFDDDRWDLLRVAVDGPSRPALVVEGVDSGNASWHPSGDRIYFGRYVGEESRLFTANADGSQIRPFGHS